MANWLHRLLNPHCPDCINDREEKKFCQSCETLNMQLARVTEENKFLLNKLLTPETMIVVDNKKEDDKVILPRTHNPWRVKQQMLETEDREKAKIMKSAPKPQPVPSTTSSDDLEKEILEAEKDLEKVSE